MVRCRNSVDNQINLSKLRSTGRHYYTGASIALKGEKKILSQSEWVDKKRTERPTDFAPPTNYDKGAKKQQGKRAAEAGMDSMETKTCFSNLEA